MTAINLLLAVLGGGVTVMVAAGMVLLTPRGVETQAQTALDPTIPAEQPDVDPDPGVISPV